jgi:hypothetical protein
MAIAQSRLTDQGQISVTKKRADLGVTPTDSSAIRASAPRPHYLAGLGLARFRKFAVFHGKNRLVLARAFGLIVAKSRAKSDLARLLPWKSPLIDL